MRTIEPARDAAIDAVVREREVLTVEQAAAYLQMNKVTIYKYIRAGLLPAARLGKVYRIHRRDLEALLKTSAAGGR
ncbi:MAG TPA: helix-turn-helix domain-containing protein [bacterium]|nr:helix-turn-helix domain-containing protein [bacterium]